MHEFRHAVITVTDSTTKVSSAFLNFGGPPQLVKSLQWEVKKQGSKLKLNSGIQKDEVKCLDMSK